MDINSVFEKVKYFIIDMDGTFYLDGTLIDGALDFLDRVHACCKDFCFFTNNSSNNVAVCREKLAKMGCEVAEDKIVISSHVTADYLNRHKAGKTVFLLGNERLTADFQAAGINLVDKDPDIVVLGFDTTLTYQKLWDACRYLANGAEYIATHPDLNCPTADGFMPDTGSMMAMIEASTGRRPLVMGKPHHYTVDYLTHSLGCESQELCFIGDRLETDILIGQKHGIPSVLVLTGVTDEKTYSGWGAILRCGTREKELSGGSAQTTNNKMELTAAIEGFKALKYPCRVTLCTDSKYVADGITKGCAASWRARGWKKSDGKPALNPELWEKLLELCGKHDVKIIWVKGHAGHPENERCDALAVAETQKYTKI